MQKNYRNSYKYLPFPCCQVGKCCCWGLHNLHKCPVKKRGKNVIFSKKPLPYAKNATELLFPVHISKTSQYVYEIFNYYLFPCSEMSQIYHLNEISHVSQADACTCLKMGSVCTLWVSLPLGILLGWKSLGIQAALGTQAVRFTESASGHCGPLGFTVSPNLLLFTASSSFLSNLPMIKLGSKHLKWGVWNSLCENTAQHL